MTYQICHFSEETDESQKGSVGGTMYFIQFDGFQSVLQGTPEFSLLYRWSHQRKEVRAVIPRLIPPASPEHLCVYLVFT